MGRIQRKSSDRRLKKNVRKIKGALNKVKRLRGVEFQWKKPKEMGRGDYGLVAQEVQKVAPLLVSGGKKGYLSVKYTNAVALLVEAIKEAEERICLLERRLAKQGQAKKVRR